jgi:phosphate transport system substrate-binding protein
MVASAGISFRDAIAKAGFSTAMSKNLNGKFVLPTADTIGAGDSVLDPRTPPDERLSLVLRPATIPIR